MKRGCLVGLTLTVVSITLSCGGRSTGVRIEVGADIEPEPRKTVRSEELVAAEDTARFIIGTKEGWSLYRFGGSAYDVWDGDVLPEFFPGEIVGVKVDQTGYKGVGDESMIDDKVGNMYFPDSRYEEWSLSFYSTEAQFQEFYDALAANGFIGGMTDGYPLVHEFVGNGCYLYMRVNDGIAGEGGYTRLVMCSLTPLSLARPHMFHGTPLLETGAALVDDGDMRGYDDELNEVEFCYDFLSDTGKLPPHYSVSFEYIGTTVENIRAWYHGRLMDGWTPDYETENVDGSFCAMCSRDDLYMYCSAENYSNTAIVGFATSPETLNR